MSADDHRASPETLAKIRALSERQLSVAEIEAILETPIGPGERAEIVELVTWFRRRYPTPADRLRYVRRAYRRWKATLALRQKP